MPDDMYNGPGKPEIRLRMKNLRTALLKPEDAQAGEKIIMRILEMPEFQDVLPRDAVVALFSPIRMEVNLLAHADLLRQKGIRIALPRVCGNTLVFSMLKDKTDLKPGVFGIMEPQADEEAVERKDLYAVCLPGLAFDRSGARLGYGKGYYDHYLAQTGEGNFPVLIGVGYDFQLLDTLPQEPHDRRLDYIVTPSATVDVRSKDTL